MPVPDFLAGDVVRVQDPQPYMASTEENVSIILLTQDEHTVATQLGEDFQRVVPWGGSGGGRAVPDCSAKGATHTYLQPWAVFSVFPPRE